MLRMERLGCHWHLPISSLFLRPPLPAAAHLLRATSLPHSLACARGLMVLECHCCVFFFSALFSKKIFLSDVQEISPSRCMSCGFISPASFSPLSPTFRWPAPTCASSLWSFHPSPPPHSERPSAPLLKLPPFHPVYKMPTGEHSKLPPLQPSDLHIRDTKPLPTHFFPLCRL